MASSSFLDKGTVEGYNMVALVSQLQVIQKFNACDKDDPLQSRLWHRRRLGWQEKAGDFLLTVDGTIDIDGGGFILIYFLY